MWARSGGCHAAVELVRGRRARTWSAGCSSQRRCAGRAAGSRGRSGGWWSSSTTGWWTWSRRRVVAAGSPRPPARWARSGGLGGELPGGPARRARAGRRGRAPGADRAGTGQAGEWIDPMASWTRCVPGGVAGGARGAVRRALPGAARARPDHRHAVAPAVLPDGPRGAASTPLRVRRERRRTRRRGRPGTRRCWWGGWRTPRSRTSKDLARGIAAMLAELRRVSFLEGGGSLADKTERVGEISGPLCDRVEVERRCARRWRARPSCARPTWYRAWCRSSPTCRGTRGRSMRAMRVSRPGVRGDRGASPAGRAGGGLPAARRARCSRSPTRRNSRGRVRAGRQPTGSRDPYGLRRAAAGMVAIALERGYELGLVDLMGSR